MVIILAYHGVTEVKSAGVENWQGKHIAADVFEAQIRQLRETEQVLRLRDLVEAYEQGRHCDGVVVTFDDGYRNNATVALPILERYGVPATFFLSSGFIGTDRMFWVDEVEFLMDQTDVATADLTEFGLKPFSLCSRQGRAEAVVRIKSHLKRLDDRLRRAALDTLRAKAPVSPTPTVSLNYQILTWAQARALAQHPLVDIGAHSVDHSILTRVPRAQLEFQVQESKAVLERGLGRPITMFAYPNGGCEDYGADVIEVVRAAGFRCACTTVPGMNEPSVSLFELRRHMVGFCGEPFPLVDAALV